MIKNTSAELLEALQDWYHSNLNGDWEHEYGIEIENIDNPGWTVSIPLTDTSLEGRPFTPVNAHRADDDWLSCRVEGQTFLGGGGSRNLAEIIRTFLDWAHSAPQ